VSSRGAATRGAQMLVVSDLDGCLLDETSYDFEAARPALALLAGKGVPLVIATSKTRHEIASLREALDAAAVVVENGGALLLPEGGPLRGQGVNGAAGPATMVLGEERRVLVQALQAIASETGARLRSFTGMDRSEVSRLTGLDPADAGLAMQREYDEPFLLEDDDRAAALSAAAEARGLRVTRGGRFWHLTGDTDKGRALRALLDVCAGRGLRFAVVALGDSPNDLSLLRAAHRPIVIPRPGGAIDPELKGALPAAERAPLPGPAGWNAAVLAVLDGGTLPAVSDAP
jgi:mannosyl-3-phosphoglycerate phosphatase